MASRLPRLLRPPKNEGLATPLNIDCISQSLRHLLIKHHSLMMLFPTVIMFSNEISHSKFRPITMINNSSPKKVIQKSQF
jgi:hypothetical protein